VQAALIRYRAIAYLVGVVLILLVVIGMPLKYLADEPVVVETVGPAHGFLYMVYLVAAFDLARRNQWALKRMALVMLAGTVPFVSFYAERVVTRWVRERSAVAAPTPAEPASDVLAPPERRR
jgi:integral membrane protein